MALAATEFTCEQLLGFVSPLFVLLLHFAEELCEFLITGLLGVLNVLIVGLCALKRVIQNADQIIVCVLCSSVSSAASHVLSPLFCEFEFVDCDNQICVKLANNCRKASAGWSSYRQDEVNVG